MVLNDIFLFDRHGHFEGKCKYKYNCHDEKFEIYIVVTNRLCKSLSLLSTRTLVSKGTQFVLERGRELYDLQEPSLT